MKIAYVTTYDASDVHAWSGTGSHILQALRQAGFEVEPVGGLKENLLLALAYRIKKLLYRKFFFKGYVIDREPRLLARYARQVEKKLAALEFDLVFSPGTVPIAHLKTNKPILFWTDATFAGMVDFYNEFTNISEKNKVDGHNMEQSALSKATAAIYCSQWAADSAVESYKVHPEKVRVLPFGANLAPSISSDLIRQSIKEKSFAVCKLLFLGADWERKGGREAVKIAARLNELGLKTELKVVGCSPGEELPGFVDVEGYVSKKRKSGREKIEEILLAAHFLVLPVKAECFGIVFAEASSFGLPSLTNDVGGVSAVVSDRNGRVFPLNGGYELYCNYIMDLMSSRQDYEKLATSTLEEYSARLNWSTNSTQLRDLIDEFVTVTRKDKIM